MASEVKRLLRLRQVINLIGISRSSIYQLERDGRFPKRVAIGPRSVAWRESEILEWIASRQRKASAC